MKVFINNLKSLPVAVSGLALGVAGLGNILGSEIYVGFRYFCATITLFILLLVLIKNLHHPKTPKQNAKCERVNQTIQDEFMIKYGNLLFSNLNLFNKKLTKYLYWFNFKRVHQRFNNKITPFQRH